MLERLKVIAKEVAARLQKSKLAGRTITLKIRNSNFRLHTRSKTLPYYIADQDLILETVKELLYQQELKNSVRLLGISLTNLNNEEYKKDPPPTKESIDVQLKLEF